MAGLATAAQAKQENLIMRRTPVPGEDLRWYEMGQNGPYNPYDEPFVVPFQTTRLMVHAPRGVKSGRLVVFSHGALTDPQIYRSIAQELSRRLLQRNSSINAYREKIRVFIICSVEALPIARVLVNAFEFEPFGNGTYELLREAARLAKEGRLLAIAGGGDTVAALNNAGVAQDFTYVSTAGGAFLEWLEGKTLPAVAALAESRA